MRREAIETTMSAEEQTNQNTLPDEATACYEVHLRLSDLPAGGAEEIRSMIEAALNESVADGLVTVLNVKESQSVQADDWVKEHITPLTVLFRTLPEEFQRDDILAALLAHYHRELAFLWESVLDRRCIRGVIELRPWRRAGTQWICEFLTYDRAVPVGDKYNLHWQNTSQWINAETGWVGHQGAIVLDTSNGQVSSHH